MFLQINNGLLYSKLVLAVVSGNLEIFSINARTYMQKVQLTQAAFFLAAAKPGFHFKRA